MPVETQPLSDLFEDADRSHVALPLRTELVGGRFVVGRVLGAGGFGITYLSWETKLERHVAVKEFLPFELAVRGNDRFSVVPRSDGDAESYSYGLRSFVNEARKFARFDHLNVVRVRDLFEENHTAYLVMDYYEGMNLHDYLKSCGGSIPEKTAVQIITRVLDGLRVVQTAQLIHRDIKPQNIYLTREGNPIILDFGAARVAVGERTQNLTSIISPGYSPFEQYSSVTEQGPWTDVYACGATLYRMITGEVPPSATERIGNDNLFDAGYLTSIQCADAIRKALCLDHRNRPQTAAAFQTLLLESQAPVVQPRLPSPRPVPDRPPEKPPRAPRVRAEPAPSPKPTRHGCMAKLFILFLLLGAAIAFLGYTNYAGWANRFVFWLSQVVGDLI